MDVHGSSALIPKDMLAHASPCQRSVHAPARALLSDLGNRTSADAMLLR